MREVTSKVETITPTMAKDWLKTMKSNRRICATTIETYARAMKSGDWQLNGDTIVFASDGSLINGQHRLHACIKADVPFESLVARDVDKNAFSTFDCGRHRTAAQLIGMGDVTNASTISAAIPLVDKLRKGAYIGVRHATKRDYPNSTIVQMFNEDPQGYIESATLTAKYISRAKLLSPSLVLALIYFLWKAKRYDLAKVEEFFGGVMSYSSTPNVTLETLRTRLVRYTIERDKKRPLNVTYNLVAKTWDAFVTGKVLKSVSWTDNQKWTVLI